MVASAVFITDLGGKAIISRNYRGDIPLTKAIDRFAKYLHEVEDEAKRPVFNVDANGDLLSDSEDVGSTGPGGHSFVYVQVCIIWGVGGDTGRLVAEGNKSPMHHWIRD